MSVESDILFPKADMTMWRTAAEKALKGADFEETLLSKTADGLILNPLYERTQKAIPVTRANPATPWIVVQKMDHIDPVIANKQALEDLMNGTTGLAMVFADAHSARGFGMVAEPETFDVSFDNIDLTAITLHIEPGPRGKKTQALFADYVKRAGYDATKLNVRFGLDAIGAVAACGTMRWPFAEIQQHMRNEWQVRLDDGFTGPFFEADGRVFHDAGATEAQELAIVLANAVAFLRTLEARDGNTRLAADAIGFTLSAESDQFLTIAKFRALRLLWNRVQDLSGITPEPASLHAETSFRMLANGDPNTNMLRIASAAFAAGVGGADSMTVAPFTNAIGLPDAFARRMSRNVQSIFLEESNLYRVSDPASGSGTFEAITLELARKAWTLFQEIEALGGVDKALTGGIIHGWITAANKARRAALAKGIKPVLGVSLHAYDGSEEVSAPLVITRGGRFATSSTPTSSLPS
ncbi:MAG: methylmalonyl-CoA mutase family protein [Pseudomonadota bacterium]